jgi:hypothetical protein
MPATIKLAVIGLSLLIAARDGGLHQRDRIKALDIQERGARLRVELERTYHDLRHTGEFKSAGNDVSSIVKKYIPIGTSFVNAESTLRASGFNIGSLPPREPPDDPSPLGNAEHESTMGFAIFARLVLAQRGVSSITAEVTLLPSRISGADANTVKSVHAAIYYRGV